MNRTEFAQRLGLEARKGGFNIYVGDGQTRQPVASTRVGRGMALIATRYGIGLTIHRDGGVSFPGIPRAGGTSILWGKAKRRVERLGRDHRAISLGPIRDLHRLRLLVPRSQQHHKTAACDTRQKGASAMPAAQTVHVPHLIRNRFGVSASEARRLLAQGAVKLEGQRITDLDIDASEVIGKRLTLGTGRHRKILAQDVAKAEGTDRPWVSLNRIRSEAASLEQENQRVGGDLFPVSPDTALPAPKNMYGFSDSGGG